MPTVSGESVSEAQGAAGNASQRQLMRRAATVGLLMRNCTNLIVASVSLADPGSAAQTSGKWLLGVFGLWSLYRIGTRSQRGLLAVADYLLVLAVCAAIPMLVSHNDFYSHNSAPVAIAGTSVIGFAVSLPARVSLPMTVGIATAFACGSATAVGLAHVGDIFNLYYFAIQWTTSALIRLMLLRVAAAVDRARSDRQGAELNEQVSTAVREYEREQLALLHDTAASTLLMVGQGTSLPPARLAAQARRDLELLDEGPWAAPPPQVELVAALRDCAAHLDTPVRFTGRPQVWLDGYTARAVIAAAREAMTNVDRHARAGLLTVTATPKAVLLVDDGVGFDPAILRDGHGVSDSIIGRMRRAGGDATISSAAGAGTSTELSWRTPPAHDAAAPPPRDPDRMIERSRIRYGMALTAYAVVNLAVMFPYSVTRGDHPAAQIILTVTALVATLTAVPGIRRGRWGARPFAAGGLAAVAVVQPLLLPVNELGGQHHWAQGALGWCVLPLALGLSARAGAGTLVVFWSLGAAVELVRDPSAAHMVNIGLGTASILGVQLFALTFNALMREAAADAQAETEAHQRLLRRERVTQALRAEYQRRYATLVDSVVPLLERLSRDGQVDDDLQRKARAQTRRLRVLFDQATTFDHLLMRRLRPMVDDAAAHQVDVAVDVAGDLPDLTDANIDALLGPLARVLAAATSTARIVVCTSREEMSASIVCDQVRDAETLGDELRRSTDDADVVATGGTVWLLLRHRPLAVTRSILSPKHAKPVTGTAD